jgi:hypothetical protein
MRPLPFAPAVDADAPAGRHIKNTGKALCQIAKSRKPWRRYSRRLRFVLACIDAQSHSINI